MGEALPRQDDALADRCAFVIMLARTRVGSSGTPPALRTGGKGVWSHTTDHTYAFRFKHFNFNSSYVLTGWTIIAGETTVDQTGNANSGPATVEVYDPNGDLVASLCADAAGTRFEL